MWKERYALHTAEMRAWPQNTYTQHTRTPPPPLPPGPHPLPLLPPPLLLPPPCPRLLLRIQKRPNRRRSRTKKNAKAPSKAIPQRSQVPKPQKVNVNNGNFENAKNSRISLSCQSSRYRYPPLPLLLFLPNIFNRLPQQLFYNRRLR